MTAPNPPRLFRRMLSARLGVGRVARSVIGDLDEEYTDRARANPAAARRWYRREAVAVALRARSIVPPQRGDSMMRQLLADVRMAVRTLLKQPRFAIVASLTVALGVGAVTVIFSVVNAVLIQPLRYPNADRLVNIWSTAPGLGYDQFPLSPDLFLFFRKHQTGFEDMALRQRGRVNLTAGQAPHVVESALVTAPYFSTLGATFARGRPFTADEDTPKAARVAVISDRLWRGTFGADQGVLARAVRVDGEPTQIVGVAPDWLDRTGTPDMWLPARFNPDSPPTGNFGWNGIGRLKPGVRPEDAAKQLEPLVRRAMETYLTSPNYRAFLTNGQYRPLVNAMKADIVGDVREPLWILLGTVGMVLLIACANVANLCLVRADGRQREMAVRLALGGNRSGIVRALLTEALVLSVVGSIVGVFVAAVSLPLLIRLAPASIPRLEEVSVDGLVLAVAAALSVVSAVVFGLVPALRYTRPLMLSALRHGGRSATDHPARNRGRNVLVAAQTAMAMVLLVGSGLLARSFTRMMHAELGFDPRNLLTAQVALPPTSYREGADVARFAQRLVEQLAALPSVEAAGATSDLPIAEGPSGTAFEIDGRPMEPGKLPPIVSYQIITPGFFAAMRTPIARGRDFAWSDLRAGVNSIVVNQQMVDEFWKGQDPIGKRIRRSGSDANEVRPWFTVVGVVTNVRQAGPREPVEEMIYFTPNAPGDDQRALSYVIRGPNAGVQADGIRSAVRELDADLPIASIRTMDEVVQESVVQFSFTMLTLGIAASVALVLGAIGLYSVLSYAVSLRTREIGVRLALGAAPSRVLRSVVGRGVAISLAGLVVGALGAVGLTRLLGSLLFETAPLDPLTFAAMAAVLLVVAFLASFLPARRAASISPMESMKN
ncbi:MAG TPA: ABC transporter permease [Vicinamibacterales bacterium]|nr:ABC transporter permease [Vicinamibacterales bacterium]